MGPHPAQRRGEDETQVALDDGAQLIKASLISSRSRGQKRSSEIWLDMVRSLRFPSFHTKKTSKNDLNHSKSPSFRVFKWLMCIYMYIQFYIIKKIYPHYIARYLWEISGCSLLLTIRMAPPKLAPQGAPRGRSPAPCGSWCSYLGALQLRTSVKTQPG